MDDYVLHTRERQQEERAIKKHLAQLLRGKVFCQQCAEVLPKPHYCEKLLPIELRGKHGT